MLYKIRAWSSLEETKKKDLFQKNNFLFFWQGTFLWSLIFGSREGDGFLDARRGSPIVHALFCSTSFCLIIVEQGL